MLFGLIVFLAVGILLLVLGALLWKKQTISILHDYHTKNVSREDVPAYTQLVGLGLIIMGTGCVFTGLIAFVLEEPGGWLAFPIGFLAGLILIGRAQKRYNGGWIS